MLLGNGAHLTYCTNIHPANGWAAVWGSLREHAPALKARISPGAPFGLGLRLSGAESEELLQGDRLERFKAWLGAEGLYVFTLNAFPHGAFHGQPVKAEVHAPDWRSDERVAYTLRMAEILAALLPDGMDGTISTNPLSYRPWLDGDGIEAATRNVRRVDQELRGTRIALAIEPEADGVLVTVEDVIRWWPDDLENVTVCFDACHSAVAYEEPEAALDALDEAGIRVGKAQLSAALIVPAEAYEQLRDFADPIYLHQVTERGSHRSWPDLPEALSDGGARDEWRVHFHVPIFVERYGAMMSTQEHLERCIRRVRTAHLEIETYTWDVLPPELKAPPVESIAREYEWVLDVLG